jgi:peptidoglycan/LPS O-acetylase OafA/YrhL
METGRAHRFDSIQMLRGLAALLVVCVHAINVIDFAPPSWSRGWLNTGFALNEFGATGVDLFFVISGFVMAYSTADLFAWRDAERFLQRRFWRVVPPFWAACLLFLPFAATMGNPLTPRSLFNAVTFLPIMAAGSYAPPPLVVGWTLVFELVFYVVVAAFIAFPLRRHRALALVAVTTILAVIGSRNPGGFLFNPLLGEFSLGIGVYLIWRRSPPRALQGPLLTVGAALLLASAVRGWGFDTRLAAAVAGKGGVERVMTWGVPWALVLLGCLDRQMANPRLAGVAKMLGDASYSIYLCHMFVVALAMDVVGRTAQFCPSDMLVCGIVAVAAATGVLVHRTAEQPYLRWIRKQGIKGSSDGKAPVEAKRVGAFGG